MKVAIYIRESGTGQYKPASPRTMYPSDVTFCLRYTLGGKRRWEQLSVSTYKEAHAQSLRRLGDLITEKCEEPSIGAKIIKNLALPALHPRPEPKPAVTGELMLDGAMDKYLENVATKSSKTSKGYRYTLQQFYASTGNLVLSQVTTQQLYDFVAHLRCQGLRVKFVEQKVRPYRPDELKTLFAAAEPQEWILFQVLSLHRCTGARSDVCRVERHRFRGWTIHGASQSKLDAEGLRRARDSFCRTSSSPL